jgi:hypothetical protein
MLGALKWIDAKAATPRFAPLLLVPFSLERGNAGEKFKLRARPDERESRRARRGVSRDELQRA